MFNKTKVIIEKNERFSKSILWEVQRLFFKDLGVKAWFGYVPYYITSNPTIANIYATVTLRFIQDHVNQKNYDPQQPFYIIELGAGPGKFSFYMVKRLQTLLKQLQLEDIKIKYIMTDFAQTNIDFWKTQPQLKPFIESNFLDLAIYDVGHSDTIKLECSGEVLGKEKLHNPVVSFGNYLFDSLPQDIFHVENRKLYAALTRISSPKDNINNKVPVKLDKLDVNFHYDSIKASNYYKNPHLNKVLELYTQSINNSSFLFPTEEVGAKMIDKLKALSNGPLMMIATDKAYALLPELEGLRDPRLAFHGNCFSMMVNFHAIGEYIRQQGGDYVAQSPRRGIKTCFFLLGEKLDKLPETNAAVQEHIESFSLADFFNMHEHMKKSKNDCELRILGAHMNFCRWDPHIFRIFSEHLYENINKEHSSVKNGFIQGMPKIMENFYYMPNKQDTPFEIAFFFQRIKDYQQAIHYYDLSIHFFGKSFMTIFNKALCLYLTDEFSKSLEYFKEALAIDPDSQDAQQWVARLEEELSSKT